MNRHLLTLAGAVVLPVVAAFTGVGHAALSRISYSVQTGRTEATLDALSQSGDFESAFTLVAGAVSPSVVAIRTVSVRPAYFSRQVHRGVGSGVIVSEDGLILTNNHVVDGATRVQVELSDGRELAAEVLGTDPMSDLALVRVSGERLQPARLGDSEALKVGQWVMAFGSPFGLDHSVSAGIVSALDRRGTRIARYEGFIQTDAAINSGNSGGPLVNLKGEVVGINVAIMSRSGGSHGVGFAIPVARARRVMDQILKNGRVERGFLGLTAVDSRSGGVSVYELLPEGPARKAGIRLGDRLERFAGVPVKSVEHFVELVGQHRPGERVEIAVERDGQEQVLEAVLGRLRAR